MGIKVAPDIFQEKMYELFVDLEFVRVYLDDLLILTTGNFDKHLKNLEEVLQRLSFKNLKAHLEKCEFAVQEVEYLGYNITRKGVKPREITDLRFWVISAYITILPPISSI